MGLFSILAVLLFKSLFAFFGTACDFFGIHRVLFFGIFSLTLGSFSNFFGTFRNIFVIFRYHLEPLIFFWKFWYLRNSFGFIRYFSEHFRIFTVLSGTFQIYSKFLEWFLFIFFGTRRTYFETFFGIFRKHSGPNVHLNLNLAFHEYLKKIRKNFWFFLLKITLVHNIQNFWFYSETLTRSDLSFEYLNYLIFFIKIHFFKGSNST